MSSTFATPEKGPHEEKETKDKELETTGVRNPDHQVRDIAQDIKEEVEGSKDVMLKIDVSLGHRQRKEEGLNQRRRLFLQGLLGLQQTLLERDTKNTEEQRRLSEYNNTIQHNQQQIQHLQSMIQKVKEHLQSMRDKVEQKTRSNLQKRALIQSHQQTLYKKQQQIQELSRRTQNIQSKLHANQDKMALMNKKESNLFNTIMILREQILTLSRVPVRKYTYSPESSHLKHRKFSFILGESTVYHTLILDIIYYLLTETNPKSFRFLKTTAFNSGQMQNNYPKELLEVVLSTTLVNYEVQNKELELGGEVKRRLSIWIPEGLISLLYESIKILIQQFPSRFQLLGLSREWILLSILDNQTTLITINSHIPCQRGLSIQI